ncbi:coiled-coil domain-containing protein 115 [Orussus abietinus]|uniref:coiled-coil domain-containing protein 115 n=1 Tax=Orussus abietinus TaxID=222816 RepID=UPI0006256837|nr:coiled-coil domain-containing protein 115 [Orussus abietinus]
MPENLEDVCTRIDGLTIQNLELMEEKISTCIQMEQLLRDGHIELAKTRYIRGKESFGILQVPAEDRQMTSLFDLETTITKNGNNIIPHFDITLKDQENSKELFQDPIKWFGVLVPQNLKVAQKRFQTSLSLSVQMANVQSKIAVAMNEIECLKILKNNLLIQEE